MHYNVEAIWTPSIRPALSYRIYHGKPGEALKLLGPTQLEINILHPDQLGYKDGDEMDVAISIVNSRGEGPLSDRATILLPLQVDLPEKVTGLKLSLVSS